MCVFHSVQWYAELLWLSSQFEVQSLLRLGNLVSQMQNTLKNDVKIISVRGKKGLANYI